MTKGEQVYTRVEELVASGSTKADAFKALAEEFSQPLGSVRGAYYGWTRQQDSTQPRRTRRRETTPEDALADARAVLERAIVAVDAEVDAAEERVREAAAEHEALKASAEERKEAIAAKLATLG